MGNYRKIMERVFEGRSYNGIVEAVGCSRRDVSMVKKSVAARGLTAALAVVASVALTTVPLVWALRPAFRSD